MLNVFKFIALPNMFDCVLRLDYTTYERDISCCMDVTCEVFPKQCSKGSVEFPRHYFSRVPTTYPLEYFGRRLETNRWWSRLKGAAEHLLHC